jgi:nucleoside 2-deoxyribosyltransferase
MKKVYVSGALTDVPNAVITKKFYEKIGKLCQEKGFEAYVPHVNGTDPIENPNLTPNDVFETDYYHVSTADMVIAYVGAPSLGVGIELGWAHLLGIPTALLYEEDKRVSRLPRGLPPIIAEIKFQNYEEALEEIGNLLEQKHTHEDNLAPTQKGIIRLEIKSPPHQENQKIVIRNGKGGLIYEGEAPHDEKTFLLRVLNGLRKKGINPELVYIEHFPDVTKIVKAAWPTVSLRYEYSDK